MRALRLLAAGGIALALVVGTAVAGATPASAREKNGVVEAGEIGLYASQNQGGPVFDLQYSEYSFVGQTFPGYYLWVDNNTLSYWNRNYSTWFVWTDPGFGGLWWEVPPGYGNLPYFWMRTVSSASKSV